MGVRENIIELRKLTGVTQAELGHIAGVSRGAVSQWEGGFSEPRMGNVRAISNHFHIREANIIEDGGMDNIAVSATGTLYELEATGALSLDERKLLTLYRACGDKERDYMLQVAQVIAGGGPMGYGEALQTVLKETGTSQAELTRRLGLGNKTAYVSQLCNGKIKEPSISKALEIARALGVSIDRFAELMDS